MGDYLALSGWTLNAVTCVFKEGVLPPKGGDSVTMEAEFGVVQPGNAGNHQKLEGTRILDAPLEPVGVRSYQYLDFGLMKLISDFEPTEI